MKYLNLKQNELDSLKNILNNINTTEKKINTHKESKVEINSDCGGTCYGSCSGSCHGSCSGLCEGSTKFDL